MLRHLKTMENNLNSNINALLVSGGHINYIYTPKYLEQSKRHFDIVIAIDGGLEAVNRLHLFPTHIIGDYDTVSKEILEKYVSSKQCEIIKLNPEKDLTDTQAAIEKAIELGASYIEIIGGTGTRLDHTFANIHTLQLMLGKCKEAVITNENNRIRLVDNNFIINKNEQYGKYVSFLPLTEKVEGITLKGFKYPLESFEFNVRKTLSLGVSNEIVDEKASVSVKSGILIMIESMD